MEIENLDLEVKTYNRLKKAGIDDTDDLLDKMYQPDSVKLISQPDMKRVETALKTFGLIEFMRGDYVTEDKIVPEPLTWDELHNFIGQLVVFDCSTESHRWLKVNWIYDMQDAGEGTVICSDGSRDYSYIRRRTVEGGYNTCNPEYLSRHECLKFAGRFYALKSEEVKTVSEAQVMSAEYTKAVTLTKRIKANAAAAQESLWEVCKGLKEMHDGKLYKELGYQNFEEYTEKEVGIKRLQARKYVAIADIQNGQSTNHFETIGTEKLYLLAKLDEPQREEIKQTVDLENTSVKELKKQIADLEKEKSDSKERQDKLFQKNMELVKELEEKKRSASELDDKLENAVEAKKEAFDTIRSLEKQIQELENRPVEVAVQSEKVADNGAILKAYTQSAVDAMKRLTSFCVQNADCPERKLFIEKLEFIVQLTNQSINQLKGETLCQ